MKKLSFFLVVTLVSLTVFMSSFTTSNEISNSDLNPPNEFETLLNYLETNNNFINTNPQLLISADEVKKNLKNPKYHIIDIRTNSWYEYAHIKGTVNVLPDNLPDHFENNLTPKDYDKIVIICYSGQSATYYASLLRLSGYDNVFSMKWGMASWRLDFAENTWLKYSGDENASKLETSENAKSEKGNAPILSTSKSDAKEILHTQLAASFAQPYNELIINADDVFANPENYFIVNYWELDKYKNGHIPTAVHYDSNGSLSSSTDLLTLPTDKKIAIYCETGQKAAAAVAYLKILGYDVGNIAYGSNRFMNKILKENGWDAFTKKEVNMFPVVE